MSVEDNCSGVSLVNFDMAILQHINLYTEIVYKELNKIKNVSLNQEN